METGTAAGSVASEAEAVIRLGSEVRPTGRVRIVQGNPGERTVIQYEVAQPDWVQKGLTWRMWVDAPHVEAHCNAASATPAPEPKPAFTESLTLDDIEALRCKLMGLRDKLAKMRAARSELLEESNRKGCALLEIAAENLLLANSTYHMARKGLGL